MHACGFLWILLNFHGCQQALVQNSCIREIQYFVCLSKFEHFYFSGWIKNEGLFKLEKIHMELKKTPILTKDMQICMMFTFK